MEFNQHQREVFKKLHETKEYSDLTLVCEDKQFPVHKAIVCTQSSVIAAACNGRFTEASENVVRVTEFDATTLKRMLEFMYLGEYEVQDTAHIGIKTVLQYQNELLNLEYTEHSSKHGNSNDDNSIKCDYNSSKPEPDFGEWTIETECNEFNECNECNKCNERNANAILTMLEPHIGVNAIADYYNVSALKDRAQAMILYILRTSWSASGFLDAVGEIFQTTADKRLHGIIASTAMDHLQELIGTKQFAEMDLPSVFAVDVIRRTGERLREMEDKLQDVETQRGDVWNWTSRLISESSKEAWDLKAVNERLNSAIARIQANTNCRHCSAEFNCVIREKQRPGRTSTYVVRCRRCGTKHY